MAKSIIVAETRAEKHGNWRPVDSFGKRHAEVAELVYHALVCRFPNPFRVVDTGSAFEIEIDLEAPIGNKLNEVVWFARGAGEMLALLKHNLKGRRS